MSDNIIRIRLEMQAANGLTVVGRFGMGRKRQPAAADLKAKPEIVQTLAANLDRLMLAEDLSNVRLAKLTNGEVSEGTVQRARTGQASISIDHLAALAKVFGLRPWQILTEHLDPQHPPQLTFPTARERELYARFKEFIESSK